VSPSLRARWSTIVVLASLFVSVNLVEIGTGDGGWPQVVGIPLGVGLAAYGVARILGWEGAKR
jgi:hypothetical protein